MTLRIALSGLALTLLLALIWWFGPLISVSGHIPLETVVSRVLLMTLVSLCVLAPLAWQLIQRLRSEMGLKRGLTRQQEEARDEERVVAERFSAAIQTLRQHQHRRKWRLTRPGLYGLPWYVLIGPPGSGKTTALMHSGLRFPLQATLGVGSIQGVGGTRHCDWWFTDDAVLIDTAGRFTTQDSNQQSDAAAWSQFLNLLKRHRPRQALNGVLLVISVADLNGPSSHRDILASNIARRLQELTTQLGACPPVYVLVTKLDLLPGFIDTCAPLSEADRQKGLGINLPHPLPADWRMALQQGFSQIQLDLQEGLHARLDAATSGIRKIRLMEFLPEFANLQTPLMTLLENSVRTESTFEKNIDLRGVYFTSGTQDGGSLDRILSGLNRLAGQDPSAGSPREARSYFIQRLLTEVVFAEQHLAGVNWRQVHRERTLRMLAWCALMFFSVIYGLLSWVSYTNNRNWLGAQSATAGALQGELDKAHIQNLRDLPAVVHALNVFTEPSEADTPFKDLGLNQTDKVNHAREQAYRRGLQHTLAPLVEQQLAKALEDSIQRGRPDMAVYEQLKALVMWHDPVHRDTHALMKILWMNWSAQILPTFPQINPDDVKAHLVALLAMGPEASPADSNARLIESARRLLQSQSTAQRIYQSLKNGFIAPPGSMTSITQVVGASSAHLFKRQDGGSLSEPLSALFTKSAAITYIIPESIKQAQLLAGESQWVLGQDSTPVHDSPTEIERQSRQVRELYVADYIQYWDSLLRQVQLDKPGNLDEAVNGARTLAQTESPLKTWWTWVWKQTRLGADAMTALQAGQAVLPQQVHQGLPGKALSGGANLLKADGPSRFIEQQVDDHFRTFHDLFAGQAEGYARVGALLNDVYAQLAAVAAAQRGKTAPPASGNLDTLKVSAGLLPDPVRLTILPLINMAGQQGDKAERANMADALKPLRDLCLRTVANRYPFQTASGLDVLSDDFVRLFAPGGQMDQFFQTHLQAVVDRGSNPWRFKPAVDGASRTGGAYLAEFQRAARIRDVLFAEGGQRAGFELDLKLVSASSPNDVFYLDNNGKLLMFSMQWDPRHTLQWTAGGPTSFIKYRVSNMTERLIQGPWALFRWMDLASIQTTDRPELFKAAFVVDGKRFEFEVLAHSAIHPLRLTELRKFSCPGTRG
ncbi:type VI secretion system membrane subunit TssM [Limnobacter humi]|uniref:Type VI secretion system membrane subunit TssM n=1 Tax=Limnobacter humi TaxID=1778671 RepID=A0ABT1WD71_9BURK|nr:type VI secretion system membrane subunit TssM [Limnobacter humi]MCQ8895466.1 type VI secretion system membrane subunit TssM [Limnobacter humi]